MDKSISFNQRIQPAADSSVRAVSSAALYGKGIFTTIAIYDGKPFLWEKHWRRLTANAATVGINIAESSEQTVASALAELIEENKVTNGRERITFFDESSSGIWNFESERKTILLIITADAREIPEHFKLTISPHRINTTSPLAGVKSCNYLEHLMAFDEAKSRGFNEAIRLNERGEVASACMANVFWLKDEKLYTPSLKTGCLPGTTREFILENLECEEIEAGIESIQDADAIFLTSAGIRVLQVAEFDGSKFVKDDHPIRGVLPNAV